MTLDDTPPLISDCCGSPNSLIKELEALIANQVREAYRKGYNDNARDCYCRSVEAPKSVLPHKHLMDDGESHAIRPDILKGDDK